MKTKYILSSLICLILASTILRGQYSLPLSASVRDIQGNPISGREVLLQVQTPGGSLSFLDTTLTDTQGQFFYTLNFPVDSSGILLLQTRDCQQNGGVLLRDSLTFSSQSGSLLADFIYCKPPCQAHFSWTNSFANRMEAQILLPRSPGARLQWDFGDGDTASGPQVLHDYAQPGAYQVQLILDDPLVSCKDSFQQTVNILGNDLCRADFQPLFLSWDSVFFENLSQHSLTSGGSISYQWTLGDGESSTDVSPTHLYEEEGDYLVCLLIEDDFGCRDTTCQTVSIIPPPGCDAGFVYNQISNLTVAFSAVFAREGQELSWSLGDGSTYTESSFFHTFGRADTFEVCLLLSDSTQACRDTQCQQVILSGSDLCASDFTWNYLDGNEVAFFQLAGGSDPEAFTYQWSFGEGGSSSLPNPVYSYTDTGNFTVCLSIQGNNCSQKQCYPIKPGSLDPVLYSISGWVYQGGLPAFDARTFLYKNDTLSSSLDLLGELRPGFQAYKWQNLSPGSYLVHAEHLGDGNFVPTYLGGEIHWEEALASILNDRNVVNPPLRLREGIDVEGSGSISGKLSDGFDSLNSLPLADRFVLLLADDAQRSPISYERSDAGGSFAFEGLPLGIYWLHPEIPGIYTAPKRVEIKSPGEKVAGIDFALGDEFIFPTSRESIFESSFQVFPNPARSQVKVGGIKGSRVKVFNAIGQELETFTLDESEEKILNLHAWPEGLYVVEWIKSEERVRKKLLLRNRK